jgi:small conductance mechanosensitive channel
VLGLNKALSSILAGIGVIGLACFAFQDIAANFLSGIILAFREPLKRGIETKDVMGTVTKTNLRDTVIETFKAQKFTFLIKTFAAFLLLFCLRKRRIDLVVGVYADDLEKVEDVVLSAIKNLEGVIDKDLMVLTILNLTLVPSILIFDFGLNIRRTQLLQDEKQSYQSD